MTSKDERPAVRLKPSDYRSEEPPMIYTNGPAGQVAKALMSMPHKPLKAQKMSGKPLPESDEQSSIHNSHITNTG